MGLNIIDIYDMYLTFDQAIIYLMVSLKATPHSTPLLVKPLPASLVGAVKPGLLNLLVSFDLPQLDWA